MRFLKNVLKKFTMAAGLILAGGIAYANNIAYSGTFQGVEGPATGVIASTKTYTRDLNTTGDRVSLQVVYSTFSGTTATFTDGSQSSGTITVSSNTAVSSATATNYMTVLSTGNLSGACITLGGQTVPVQTICNNGWRIDVTSDTAADVVKQMNANFSSIVSTSGNSSSVISSTAIAYGTAGNSLTLTSNISSITVNSANFTGGLNNACFSINGVSLCANTAFQVGASSQTTATNMAAAVNANSTLSAVLVATATACPGCGVVYATSTLDGAVYNYALTSSSNPVFGLAQLLSSSTITGSTGQMSGGTTPAYSLNGTKITIPFHGFATNLQVLYSTSSGVGITGLTTGTTYYVGVVNVNTLFLSSSSTGAIQGVGIPLTSSTTKSTADKFTLTPSTFTNTSAAGVQIQWSDNDVNFSSATTGNWAAAISSITFALAGGTTMYDLGPTQHRYLRLNVIPPTTGAVNFTATDNERYSYQSN